MVRFAGPPSGVAALLLVVGLSTSAHAQEPLASGGDAPDAAAPQLAAPARIDSQTASAVRGHQRRPAALIPLYASFVTLEALDIHSTRSALARGAVEANPAMRGLTGSSLGMVTVKAAGTAGLIFASEKMWRKNKAAAVVLMIATNSAMAWVVEHNYRIAR
jgi:Domain of unknown function (DUF5658)